MKILFAGPEQAWSGFYNSVRARLPQHQFSATGEFRIHSLRSFDVLIPTMTAVSAETLHDADQLCLIQQVGVGLEGVDIAAAQARGIAVANVPSTISGNADSVAELGIYLTIGLARDARAMQASLGKRQVGAPQGMALRGKTVGVVGLGGIGQALIARLKPFGVRLYGLKQHDPAAAKNTLGLDWAGSLGDLPELLTAADFVVLCLPDTPKTHGLMNAQTLALMKPGAFLINLGRGGLIERDALEQALLTGHLGGAGLDVYWQEPPDPDDPIFRLNVLTTPHVAGVTDVSTQGIMRVVVENIERVARGEPPLYTQ